MGNGPGSSEKHSTSSSTDPPDGFSSQSAEGEEMDSTDHAEVESLNICTNHTARDSSVDQLHKSHEKDKLNKGFTLSPKREKNTLTKTATLDHTEASCAGELVSKIDCTDIKENKTHVSTTKTLNSIASPNSSFLWSECNKDLSAFEIHLEPSCTQTSICKNSSACAVSCSQKILTQGNSSCEKNEKPQSDTTCSELNDSSKQYEKYVDEVQKTLVETISKLKHDIDWCPLLGQISKTMRSCENPEDAMKVLIKENFLGKLEEFLDQHHVNTFVSLKTRDKNTEIVWPVIKRFLIILWITCDKSVNFCQYLLNSKVFLFLLSELRVLASVNYEQNQVFLFIIKSVLGILHNISRHVPNSKWNLRNEGLVTILRTFLPSDVAMVRLKSLIVLSYLLSEAENEIINSEDDNFVFVFNVLTDALSSQDHKSSKYGMNASEVLRGISNLAINDENKIRIVRNGGLPLYQQVLSSGFPDEIKITIMTLWSLAFHHYNKKKMRELPGIMGKLYELRQCDDEEICHAARGTFWELENTSKSAIGKNFSSSAEKDPSQPHIMISYQWDSQPIMLKVKDRLKHAGYKVWMDVEHMSGSTLEAMALAVEKAAVVLICMSEKYKNSPNCRTEAEYVYRLRKDFVPLRLQQEYVPDGWLGILVGTRLYFDMETEDLLDIQLPKLLKELSDRGKISPSDDVTDAGIPPRRMLSRESVPVLHQPEGREVTQWACHNVAEWLESIGLTEAQKISVQSCQGYISVLIFFQDVSNNMSYDRIGQEWKEILQTVEFTLEEIDGPMLLELQKIQKSAPQFFYTLLKTDLQFSTVMILKFSRSLRGLR